MSEKQTDKELNDYLDELFKNPVIDIVMKRLAKL